MRLIETPIPGAWLVEIQPMVDERGFFARIFDRDYFESVGLEPRIGQASISFNTSRGTLRGMHFQDAPHEEFKLIRCIRGAVFDVLVDLRLGSPTYCHWHSEILSADNRKALYVSPGIAHGYLTLEHETELLYQMSCEYAPDFARGVRWNDSAFAIEWPFEPKLVSDRDSSWPDWEGDES